MYEEAHPVFYATQTFHYSFTTGGLSQIELPGQESRWSWLGMNVREGAMPFFSDKLHLMVNLSVGLEVISPENTDAVLSKQIRNFVQQRPQLRTLTINLLRDKWSVQDFPAGSATGNVLRQLHPSLNKLSIVVLGSSPQEVIPDLRRSIADDRYWSNVCISLGPNQPWSAHQTRTSNRPHLTIPSMIQGYVHRACSQSSPFCYPPPEDDQIYEWTCHNNVNEEENKVKEGVRPAAFPIANWVLELEKQRSEKT